MHNPKVEQFFKEEATINVHKSSTVSPIQNYPVRSIKDILPYLHDDRLLMLEATVGVFNFVLELKLRVQQKMYLLSS